MELLSKQDSITYFPSLKFILCTEFLKWNLSVEYRSGSAEDSEAEESKEKNLL